MNKLMNNIQQIKNNYLEAKKITMIALDPDHPMNEFVRENISVGQLYELQQFTKDCEDQGIHLIGRELN